MMAATDERDPKGRFAKGNSGGPGNPHAAKVATLRGMLLDAVAPQDVREVVQALVASAKEGNVQAMKEFFNRLLGPSEAVDLLARLGELEALLSRAQGGDEGHN